MKTVEKDPEREDQEPTQTGPNYGIERVSSFTDLKSKYLEKEADLLEVNIWIRQLTHYINTFEVKTILIEHKRPGGV